MTHIGFIGLGQMGSAIASNLIASGHDLVVWNRSDTAAAQQLIADGASRAQSASEALGAPVSFSMLANDAAADEVLSDANIADRPAGRIHVNMASISADMADHLAERFARAGVTYVSAPVLGRPEVAAAAKLNVILSGPAAALDAVEPLLAHVSLRRWRFGSQPRQAVAVKIAMNFMLLQSLESLGEGIALAEAQGVDPGEFVELIGGTFFGGAVHTGYGAIIANRRYSPPAFSMRLGLKDLSLAEALADASGLTLPTAPVIRKRLESALSDPNLADLDWSAIAELSRSRSF